MKQRLGIAAAMLSDPDLLLLDEPANGLDPGGMVAMRETLRWFTGELGKTVVISSHLLHEVELLADVVGIIDHGRIIREGDLDQLLEDAGRVRVRVRPEDMQRAARFCKRLAPDRPLYGVDSGEQQGWFTVNVIPARAAEINRALAEAGIYASGLEPGSRPGDALPRDHRLPGARRATAGCAAAARRAACRPPVPPLVRLIRAELLKARRRQMTWVLLGCGPRADGPDLLRDRPRPGRLRLPDQRSVARNSARAWSSSPTPTR